MKSQPDMLYSIFEQHLFNALVEEETAEEFVGQVVSDYLCRIRTTAMIPRDFSESVESDLRDEVLEMLRKKIYGHYNLNAFRKTHGLCLSEKSETPSLKKRRRES